uniref:Uncharacterized protein n=1 Tax=Anopheles farauti TaxID=69004 RepID=A0A182QYQ8_9DIPT
MVALVKTNENKAVAQNGGSYRWCDLIQSLLLLPAKHSRLVGTTGTGRTRSMPGQYTSRMAVLEPILLMMCVLTLLLVVTACTVEQLMVVVPDMVFDARRRVRPMTLRKVCEKPKMRECLATINCNRGEWNSARDGRPNDRTIGTMMMVIGKCHIVTVGEGRNVSRRGNAASGRSNARKNFIRKHTSGPANDNKEDFESCCVVFGDHRNAITMKLSSSVFVTVHPHRSHRSV